MNETVVITHLLAAPIERVYEAWTNPIVMARWFFVGEGWRATVQADVRVGGRFRIDMETETGEHLVSSGQYLELQHPSRVKLSWNSYAVSGTIVTIDLVQVADGTQLTLTHEGLPTTKLATRHANGWASTLANLSRSFK